MPLYEAGTPSTKTGFSISRENPLALAMGSCQADIIIFDKNEIRDKLNYFKLNQYSQGIKYVMVNGKLAVENEHLTEHVEGKLL